MKVGILLTHPTQYHTPWFQELAKRSEIDLEVFYCLKPDPNQQGVDFGVAFEWDMPLLEGYANSFLQNVSKTPGFNYAGCDTPAIKGIVESGRFDSWIINGWRVKSEWQAIQSCWNSRVPMLIRGDSHLIDPKPLHLRVAKRLLLGRWIPRFNGYLTVGKLNEDYYQFYGANPERFFPVRHFVDNDRFAAQAQCAMNRVDELRSRWKIPEGAIVFLFVGKFIEKKRPMDVIHALERLAQANESVHLLMVGDGSLRPTCEEYVNKKKLPVSFTGFLNQNKVAMSYACSDVLVLPSDKAETWGLVVNEAMSCGLPAIVSDRVGCGPDLVIEQKTGMTFPAGDVDALVLAMETYVRNRGLAQIHGAHAKRRIAGYSVSSAADNTMAALRSISANE